MTKEAEIFYTKRPQITLVLKFVGLLFAFLLSLKVMILAFKFLNTEASAQIMVASSNPFVCLFIGLLTTALLHSSSTITAMTIAIVASGTISPASAVYMIVGANIGTTVTATIVALGHATRRKEFRKAISASMAHHFFNVFTAIIVFPLEYYGGFLSMVSQVTAGWITQHITLNVGYILSPIDVWTEPVASFILYILGNQALLGIGLAILMLFYVLQFTTQLFQRIWTKINESPLQRYLFQSPIQALLLGMFITALLQSSTVVTSLLVPIVAANKISIKRVFPFIMGANLGTTFKAVLMASSANEAALSVAFIHFYFNLFGILLFYPAPIIRNLPVNLARKIGTLTLKSRFFGFGYILLIFFLLPFFLILFSQKNIHIRQYTWTQNKNAPTNQDTPLLFYKQNYLPQGEALITNATNIYLKKVGKQIYWEDAVFTLAEIGTCYENQAPNKEMYQLCIEKIIPYYKSPHAIKADTCYVLSKRFKNLTEKPVAYFYFSVRGGLLLKKEWLNTKGKLILSEELVNVIRK